MRRGSIEGGPAEGERFTGRGLLALWVLAFSVYAVTGTGHSGSPDGTLMFLSARNLLYRGSLAVPELPGTAGARKAGPDGRQYIKYAPALVFAHLPMLVVGRIARPLGLVVLPDGSRPEHVVEDEFWAQMTSSWIAATVLVVLAVFVTRLGGSRRDAWILVLLVGLASPIWFYARVDSFETLQALALLGAVYFLYRAQGAAGDPLSPKGASISGESARAELILSPEPVEGSKDEARQVAPVSSPFDRAQGERNPASLKNRQPPKGERGGTWKVVSAGAFCGLAVLAKTFNLILVPLFLIYVLVAFPGRRLAAAVRFLFPVTAAIALTALYNHARFGTLLDTGYDLGAERFDSPLLPGVAKLLLSPSYGLVLFWPGVLLVLAGLRRQLRALPAESGLAAAIFLVLLVAYAQWWAFSGLGWGPRFLVPAIPLLAFLALPVVASRSRRARVSTLACLVLGAAVQVLVATTSHWQQILYGVYRFADCPPAKHSVCLDDPRVAPLRIAWWRVQGAWLRVRDPAAFAAHVESPPWSAAYPWREPDRAVETQRRLTGLDLWAAPERWRMREFYLWLPGRETRVPSAPALAAILLVLIAGSLAVVARDVRASRGGG